jgi:hypothetical protein
MGTRFVIIAAPRTGSNHLCHRLLYQPDIWCHAEIFHPSRVWISVPRESEILGDELSSRLMALRTEDREAFLARVLSLNYGCDHVGFKVFPGHGRGESLRLAADHSFSKVVLIRENFLAIYSSMLAAAQTSAFGLLKMSEVERPKVVFDAEEFERRRENYSMYYDRIFERLDARKQRYHVIKYEEVNDNSGFAALLGFLDARPLVVDPDMPNVRGSSNILSRFSNPGVAERYLRDNGLEHWAHEGDVASQA